MKKENPTYADNDSQRRNQTIQQKLWHKEYKEQTASPFGRRRALLEVTVRSSRTAE
jgi:hypothetical protein